jgi:hypothetical protein
MPKKGSKSSKQYTDAAFASDLQSVIESINTYNKTAMQGGAKKRSAKKSAGEMRTFTIYSVEGRVIKGGMGHFENRAPGAAAKKALRRIREERNLKVGAKIKFAIRETTQGGKSHNVVSKYQGHVQKPPAGKDFRMLPDGTKLPIKRVYHTKSLGKTRMESNNA